MKGANLYFIVGGLQSEVKGHVFFFFCFLSFFLLGVRGTTWCIESDAGPSQFKKNKHLGRKIRQQILEVRHLTKF